MVTKQIKAVTSWSFSKYSLYRKCPLAFKLSALDKINEPTNDAMQRGAHIHVLAEQYLKGMVVKLPVELKLFADEFKKLRLLYKKRAVGITVEDNWAFTNTWDRTEWNNWIKCWCRIKLDAAHQEGDDTMVITDWKTGKMRDELHEEYLEQLQLYALAAMLLHEHVQFVKPRLVYLDQGMIYPAPDDPIVYDRSDIPRLKKLWEKRVKPMFVDKTFPPRANDKCRWCFYGQSGKAKGGPGLCKY